MSKINLIPEVRQEKLRLNRMNSAVTTAVIVVGIVVVTIIVGFASYAGILTAQKVAIKNETGSVQDNLDTMKNLEATVTNLEGGLADIKLIVNGNKDWNNLFVVLEKNTPEDIQFTSLTVSSDSVQAMLTGKDVKSIDRFINSFSNAKNEKGLNYFSDVVVSSYSLKDDGQTTFQARFNLNGAAIW